MPTIRVRQVSDGEELVLAEELFEARLGLGQLDPRAESFERRHKALTDQQPSHARVSGHPQLLRRVKANDWGS